jgi:hypothetical protein
MLTKTTTSIETTGKDGGIRKQIEVTYKLGRFTLYRKMVDLALIHVHGPALLP